ncbi:MAG: TIGR03000 domain-containing protein [Gemmataceae bacterium]
MRRTALSLAFCAAALLGLPGVSSAQHGGGGHGGGGGGHGGGGGSHGGSGGVRSMGSAGTHSMSSSGMHSSSTSGMHSSAYHNGSYHNGSYHNGSYHNGYYHNGYWWPGFGLYLGFPLFSYGWGYSRYDYGIGAPYYQNNYYYGPIDSYAAAPHPPTAADYPPEAAPAQNDESTDPHVANVEVRVPANATLWILGQKSNTTGDVRHFYSPPLAEGNTYTYDIRARWNDANGKPMERTKKVDVKAGAWVGVDFNRP